MNCLCDFRSIDIPDSSIPTKKTEPEVGARPEVTSDLMACPSNPQVLRKRPNKSVFNGLFPSVINKSEN